MSVPDGKSFLTYLLPNHYMNMINMAKCHVIIIRYYDFNDAGD